MEAPTIGGMRVRKGNGETVRLARGSSLTDFAEKIGVDAASLVQMLFHLGEMVTATQSVGDETLVLPLSLPAPPVARFDGEPLTFRSRWRASLRRLISAPPPMVTPRSRVHCGGATVRRSC